MDKLQNKLGYAFHNENLLRQALTHSSYANERNVESYERLEFLGDSLLSVIISDHLFTHYPALTEGALTKIRATIVCEASLEQCALRLNLGQYIYFSHGEEQTGGRERTSILADVVESIIAAIYLDSNIGTSRDWVLTQLKGTIKDAVNGKLFKDYKTALQEHLQSINHDKITYQLLRESGPDHNKEFFFSVAWGEKTLGEGTGRTKKEAEQNAAKQALFAMTKHAAK